MIVTILVLLYLGYQTYKGYQIGFSRRIINLIFGAIVFAAAILGQNPLGNWLYTNFSSPTTTTANGALDMMIYRFVAFFIIWFIGRQIVKIVKGWLPKKDPTKHGFTTLLDNVLGALIFEFSILISGNNASHLRESAAPYLYS